MGLLKMLVQGIVLFFVATAFSSAEELVQKQRNPKVFYVSTTSSISTVSTASFCLVPSATDTAIATCAKKKKRALNILKAAPVQSSARIDPSSAVVAEDPL